MKLFKDFPFHHRKVNYQMIVHVVEENLVEGVLVNQISSDI